MKYIPKELSGNVNVSRRHPLREFFRLLAITVGGLAIIYLLLGLAIQYIAPHISPSVETAMGDVLNQRLLQNELPEESRKLQEILNRFIPHLSEDDRRISYSVYVSDNPIANAMALPGGTILAYRGVLELIKDPEEQAFILAHELGHFHHRHHLRQFGRGMAAILISMALTGENSGVSHFIVNTIGPVEMKFSRSQEYDADIFALVLLRKTFGRVQGDFTFMKKLAQQERFKTLQHYFASHPPPSERLSYMRRFLEKSPDN